MGVFCLKAYGYFLQEKEHEDQTVEMSTAFLFTDQLEPSFSTQPLKHSASHRFLEDVHMHPSPTAHTFTAATKWLQARSRVATRIVPLPLPPPFCIQHHWETVLPSAQPERERERERDLNIYIYISLYILKWAFGVWIEQNIF
jgi:hypothetical protein